MKLAGIYFVASNLRPSGCSEESTTSARVYADSSTEAKQKATDHYNKNLMNVVYDEATPLSQAEWEMIEPAREIK